MRHFLLTVIAAAWCVLPGNAQDKQQRVVALQLHPAATPPGNVALLPPLHECHPGNAAIFYQRAHCPDNVESLRRLPFLASMHEWLEKPMSAAGDKEARRLLAFTGIFKELDYAARCESCDWQMTDRLRRDGVTLLLPDLQSFRQMAQMLAVKARLEIADRRFADALRTLQTGFALGRHVGECPIVINALVGMAITQTMLGAVEDFVQRPDAPNLYWALRDLPEPIVDLRRPLQGDRLAVDAWWPEIRKALAESQPQPLALATLRGCVDKSVAQGTDGRVAMGAAVALAYPAALAYFRERGHGRAELEALPVTQLVLMHSLAQWDHWYDAVYRWHNVPYWQARTSLKKAVAEREQAMRDNRFSMIFLQHLSPAHESAFLQRARLQRRLAALQCVEAMRLHAAARDRRWPEALAEIRAVPIPNDPLTGDPFAYVRDGATARLSAAAPPGDPAQERNAFEYQITLARK